MRTPIESRYANNCGFKGDENNCAKSGAGAPSTKSAGATVGYGGREIDCEAAIVGLFDHSCGSPAVGRPEDDVYALSEFEDHGLVELS